MQKPLDLDALESRVHALPPSELTPVALALIAEVRRMQGDLAKATTGFRLEPVELPEPGPRGLPVVGGAGN